MFKKVHQRDSRLGYELLKLTFKKAIKRFQDMWGWKQEAYVDGPVVFEVSDAEDFPAVPVAACRI